MSILTNDLGTTMDNHKQPTPQSRAAEVMERLQLLYDHILDDDCLKDAIALIEQGEKERERLKQLWQDDANELAQCLVEMVSLMEGVRSGHYQPDSFTNQPSKSALSAHARLKDREQAAREQPTPESK